ncbi:Pre-mRNA splicing factor-domain-containing protein [Cladochytrium replicatum]|nr:Pre-mRNA splicing factor-domain-containing protein [Cladochytrium replicatum]
MGGGDLNLKKSWHTGTLRFQAKVWAAEEKKKEEEKKLEEMRKEKEQERQMLELQELQRAAGQKTEVNRMGWMYAAGPGGQAGMLDEDKEAFLLGKKRVDRLVEMGKTMDELSKETTFSSNANARYGMVANTVRDTQNKLREDPMLVIKQRELATLKATLANPMKLKELKRKVGADNGDDEKQRKKAKKEKKEKDKKEKQKEKLRREEMERGRDVSRSPVQRSRSESGSRTPPRRSRKSASPVENGARRRDDSGSRTPPRRNRISPSTERRRDRSASGSRTPPRRVRWPSRSPVRNGGQNGSAPDKSRRASPPRSRRSPIWSPLRRTHPSPVRDRSPVGGPTRSRSRSPPRRRSPLRGDTRRRQPSRSPPRRPQRRHRSPTPPNLTGPTEAELKRLEMQGAAEQYEIERRARTEKARKEQEEEERVEAEVRRKRMARDAEDGDFGGAPGESFYRDLARASLMSEGMDVAGAVRRNRAFVQRGGEMMSR